ncbi:MAG: ZinT family metal-binding protein [Labrenzia sp.]
MKFHSSAGLLQATALKLGLALALFAASPVAATEKAQSKGHNHSHSHGSHSNKSEIYKGYFEDDQIKNRSLSDWAGKWQSVYPYLTEGTLDPVMDHKAEHGTKTAVEYKDYYLTGYKTDVDSIEIDGDVVRFVKDSGTASGAYTYDGYEILTYKKGNRGVRYIFQKVSGDESAPEYIQFSDHKISPAAADHYHLYWGDDRAALLKEVTNWPTYYPAELTGQQIVEEMVAH